MNSFLDNPEMKSYFDSLPVEIQSHIIHSANEFSNLGELQKAAEQLQNISGN